MSRLSDDSDGSWSDDGDDCEPIEAQPPALCLFCDTILPTIEQLFQHCHTTHNIDLPNYCSSHHFDCFQFIKFVNYVRKHHTSLEDIHSCKEGAGPWNDDQYMSPTIPDDPLLQFDMEMYIEQLGGSNEEQTTTAEGASGNKTEPEPEVIQEMVEMMEKRMEGLTDRYSSLVEQVVTMSETVHTLVQDPYIANAFSQGQGEPKQIADLTEGEDDVYFESYAHFSIHQEMLQDKVRTESYMRSIYDNRESFEGKVVLDVGCGTGILSMFAARAGAKAVIAVDMSEIAYQAMDIVRENNLDNVITVLKGKIEEVELPFEKVDIIISEWMGYFLLFESMLDSVLYARDRYLAPDGILLPDAGSIHVVGLNDPQDYQKNLGCWNDMYGFKMSCMRESVLHEASVQVVSDDKICTDGVCIKDLNLHQCTVKNLDFRSSFKLTASADTTLTALLAYFDIGFNRLPNKVQFSTSPSHTPTHWKQTVFLLDKPHQLTKGETVEGVITCRKNPKDPRSLRVVITMLNKRTVYLLE